MFLCKRRFPLAPNTARVFKTLVAERTNFFFNQYLGTELSTPRNPRFFLLMVSKDVFEFEDDAKRDAVRSGRQSGH